MKKKLVIILMSAFLAVNAFADYESEIRDLKMQKEKLNSEIQKLNVKIASTDSMLRADVSRHKVLTALQSGFGSSRC
jgi:predicted  nucleic acid-binding Zn-ribbon protein